MKKFILLIAIFLMPLIILASIPSNPFFRDLVCRKLWGQSCFIVFPSKAEKKLLDRMKLNKGRGMYSVDFSAVFNNETLSKVCMQRPYEPRDHFETKAGNVSDNFYNINNEDRNVLWLFYENNKVIKLTTSYDFYDSETLVNKLQCSRGNFNYFF